MRQVKFLLCSLLLITLTACQPAATTPKASTPMLTVREATNCRTGPGENYDIIFTYLPGTNLEITGRYEPENFWLVKSDKSPTGTCWMWGEYVDVTGNYSTVSNITPPPTPDNNTSTDGVPERLFVENWEYSCSNGTLTFTLSWNDQTPDEAGYRIFRNSQQLIELPANAASYTESVNVSAGESVEYYLQVFGPSGAINSSVMRAGC